MAFAVTLAMASNNPKRNLIKNMSESRLEVIKCGQCKLHPMLGHNITLNCQISKLFFVKTFVNILFGRHFHVFAAMFTAGTRTNGTCIFFRVSFTLILRVRTARFPVLVLRGSWPAPGWVWWKVEASVREELRQVRGRAGQGVATRR